VEDFHGAIVAQAACVQSQWRGISVARGKNTWCAPNAPFGVP
jgi:hypothetical protein